MANIAQRQDIGTWAILPHWACQLTATCVHPIIEAMAVVHLLRAFPARR